jgi:hypothetical protein
MEKTAAPSMPKPQKTKRLSHIAHGDEERLSAE